MTSSGFPANFALSTGSCVAIPTGHVFKWHFLIIVHPSLEKWTIKITKSLNFALVTHDDQWSCTEAELVSPEQRSDHHVEAGAELTVGLQDDSRIGPKIFD